MAQYDLVIRGGKVVDGSGKPAFLGDVAVKDGWIAEVGTVTGSGAEEIDAKGLLVTPGFVDVHTHYDGQAIWSDRLNPSSVHGVTTVVVGNCGIGFAPCRPQDRQGLIELMEGVEDIPGAVSSEGLTWDWETFPEFMDALDRRTRDIDVGVFMPHSPIRVYVMGERALRLETATDDDCREMRKLVRDGLQAGALGIGTSKLAAHRSSKGDKIPSYSADDHELTQLAAELGDAGKGVFQLATDIGYVTYEDIVPMLKSIAKASGRTVTYTHPQAPDQDKAIDLLDTANRDDDVDIKAQLLPRPVGLMVGLSVTANPFCTTDTYLALKDLPLAERVAEMRKPEVRAAILGDSAAEPTNPLIAFARRYDRLFVSGETTDYEPLPSASIAELAKQRGQSPEETAYDELLRDDGKALMLLTMGNYEEGNLDWMEPMLDSENVVIGLGDGGAHYGMVCDASYSTFSLTHWTRDRDHGRRTLEEMVRRLARETALLVGLDDRGLVAPGHRAHLNVIDYEKLRLHKPQVISDLPAGGQRLDQGADGYVATIVHGKVIMRGGQPTDERPGKLVRGAQAALAPHVQHGVAATA